MTFSKRDSVLGIHSGDLAKFRATADLKSSSTLNFAKSPTSNTAIPRILEEESRAEQQSSLRADEIGAAIHKDIKTQNADSSPNALFPSLRALHRKAWQSISAKADSSKASKAYFASAKFIDCHAIATALTRNDSKNAKAQKVDSRICDEKTRQSRSFFSKSLLCERVQGRILGRM